MRAFLAGLCGALSCAGTAAADWEFAKWGMSVKELQEAAPVTVSLARRDERLYKRIIRQSSVLAYVRNYEWAGHRFELRFGFDRYAKLNGVFLVASDSRFEAVAATLTGIHGEPVSRAESPMPCRLWHDQARVDYIRLRWNGAVIVERMALPGEPAGGCAGAGRAAEG